MPEELSLFSNQNPQVPRQFLHSFALPADLDLAICERLLLCFVAILLDYALVPALYNGSTLWAIAALLLLVFRHGQASDRNAQAFALTELSVLRVVVFLASHALIIALGRIGSAGLIYAASSDTAHAAAMAATKFLILVPGVVLFSSPDWRALFRKYRAELIASLVVLITFFPYRLLHMIWPIYSRAIASLAYFGAEPFVKGIGFISQPAPTILGPKLDLEVVFSCSGFSALALFDTLVALAAFLDWNDLNPKRLLVAYGVGAAAILVANVVRISLLVIVGNLISPGYALGRFHVNAGWVFFAMVYLVILSTSYRWMLRKNTQRSPHA